MKKVYDSSLTMRQARDLYFKENNFGEDGGYSADWVDFKLGPIPVPFPNTAGRKRAVPYHDLHHIVTGYETNTIGEFEISAWEIGAGCKGVLFAWQINLGGFLAGLLSAPVRTWRAFVRGRRTDSLYAHPIDSLMDKTVGEIKALCQLNSAEEPKARASDIPMFLLAIVGGMISGAASLVGLAVGVPLLLLADLFRKKAAPRAV